jgi:plasmid stabilization system protein ParE
LAFRLSFTLESSEQVDKIFDYLSENRSEKIASDFIKKLNTKVSFIKEFPHLYPLTELRKNVRRCIITKQVTLYYKIVKDGILVISVFDTRQSPKKLKL